MADTMRPANGSAPRVIPENRPAMLKADLRKAENVDFLAQIGACLLHARSLLGWTLDRLSVELRRDPRQVSRWERGEERTQVDVVFSVEELRQPFVIALAQLAECEVETTVRIRRRA